MQSLDGDELRALLARFPRLDLVPHPSPLEPLPRLSAKLAGPQLWIKRDDLIGPGLGGNKGRNLAYILAEALRQGKRKIVTYGGLQSNHARITAAACAALGLEAHLFFFERRPPALEGNLLLDTIYQARLHFIPFGGGGTASMTLEMTSSLVRAVSLVVVGPGAYFMPVGGHSAVGCLGFIEAAAELQEQLEARQIPAERTIVVTATGTGGTLVGLSVGFRLLGSPVRVMGLDIGRLWRDFPRTLSRLANQSCRMLGASAGWEPADFPLNDFDYAGPGYARLSRDVRDAICLVARQEGILLDPVYSGKAFVGLMDLIRRGHFAGDEQIVFLHTGGSPALWAYGDELSDIATSRKIA